MGGLELSELTTRELRQRYDSPRRELGEARARLLAVPLERETALSRQCVEDALRLVTDAWGWLALYQRIECRMSGGEHQPIRGRW